MAFSFNRATRLRMRRVFRRRQKQMEAATSQAGDQVEKNFIGRFAQLFDVKRFVSAWLLLVILITVCTVMQTLALSGYYQTLRPVPGGTYNEGMVGTYNNVNPLYASGTVDTSVSRLIFAGLLKYDNQNNLVGELASTYSADATGRHYTVVLRPGLTWHDGKPLTAADVVFTYRSIQNPDTRSPLLSSWQGVTITAVNTLTVQFDLPNPLSSFPYSLTTGIIPQHILGAVPANQLRASTFNALHPVGAGPFVWQTVQGGDSTNPDNATTFVAMDPFENYAGGKPKLDKFVIRAYANEKSLLTAYKNRDINAMAGLREIPDSFKDRDDYTAYNFSSTMAQMAFFKMSTGVLSDPAVRQALIKSADTAGIIRSLAYPTKAVHEPLLTGQLAYDPAFRQAAYDQAAAKAALDASGWLPGPKGIRVKAGVPLTFQFYCDDTPENIAVAKQLAANWRSVGAEAVVTSQQLSDFQSTLELHTYDAVLNSISIGVDPDVFAYWDSKQADVRATNRLNFSEYASASADASLEAGRTRSDPVLRTIKYRPFLQAWQTDAPALGLYQPRVLYITRGPVYGLEEHTLNSELDHYNSVAEWQIHSALVTD